MKVQEEEKERKLQKKGLNQKLELDEIEERANALIKHHFLRIKLREFPEIVTKILNNNNDAEVFHIMDIYANYDLESDDDDYSEVK